MASATTIRRLTSPRLSWRAPLHRPNGPFDQVITAAAALADETPTPAEVAEETPTPAEVADETPAPAEPTSNGHDAEPAPEPKQQDAAASPTEKKASAKNLKEFEHACKLYLPKLNEVDLKKAFACFQKWGGGD